MNEYHFPPSITSNHNGASALMTSSFHTAVPVPPVPTNHLIESNSNSNSNSNSRNHSVKRDLPLCNNTPLNLLEQTEDGDDEDCTRAPPSKKRKKNGTTHSKLIEEFAQRSHVRNSVNLSSYHGKKQNIKTLCPYHDMLPVINIMEKEVFSEQKDMSIKKEYSNILPIIRNQCEWCCSGSPYKVECRNLLMRVKELYEYEFEYNDIALPFMNAAVLGGPNPNICIKLNKENNNKQSGNNNALGAGAFNITFKPLQNLSLIERNDTCNVALKAISCGTFKRNLQPVPDACRITKLLDGDGCFIRVNPDNHNQNNDIYFKVSTCEVRQRRKLQGTDSVLGVGFDCASRLSWQKPRIYWMHQSIHTLRDKKSKKIIEKKHVSNRDLRFSVLVPFDFHASITIYMIGIQTDRQYTVHTNTPCVRQRSVSANDKTDGNVSNESDNSNTNNNPNTMHSPNNVETDSRNSPNSASTTASNTTNGACVLPLLPITSNAVPPALDNQPQPPTETVADNTITTTQNQSFPPPPTNTTHVTLSGSFLNNNTSNEEFLMNNVNHMNGATTQAVAINPINNINNINSGMLNGYRINHMNMNGAQLLNMNVSNASQPPISFNAIPACTQYVNTAYNPTMIYQQAMPITMNNMPYAASNAITMNNMNSNTNSNTNNTSSSTEPTADKSKYIDDDLQNARKNYIDLLHGVNFQNENYQTCASKWIRICLERYNDNEDVYHTYLLNLVQSLITSIGDEKTVRGLKRRWMNYNNIDNEWSFLHLICSKNLLYLFQSIVNLLMNYKHELLVAVANIHKDSTLRISPLHCCIINNNHQFTKYLFDYYLTNLTSQDILTILQNGGETGDNRNNSLLTHLINYNHTQTLQQVINVNASRGDQFLTIPQVQLVLKLLQNPQQVMDAAYSNSNAFTK